MAYPTMIEIANIFKQKLDDAVKIKESHNEPILVDRYTLVWAEYWLRWAKEHVYIKDFTMPKSCAECPIRDIAYQTCPLVSRIPEWQYQIGQECSDKRSEHCPLQGD